MNNIAQKYNSILIFLFAFAPFMAFFTVKYLNMDFKFPDVGEGIEEGKVVKLMVDVGDEVHNDQVIAEVETDKAIVEIPIPFAGKISKINFNEGDIIHVGDVFVTVSSEQDSVSSEQKTVSSPLDSVITSQDSVYSPPSSVRSPQSSVIGKLEVSEKVYNANISDSKIKENFKTFIEKSINLNQLQLKVNILQMQQSH